MCRIVSRRSRKSSSISNPPPKEILVIRWPIPPFGTLHFKSLSRKAVDPYSRATAVTIAHGSTAGYELDAFAAVSSHRLLRWIISYIHTGLGRLSYSRRYCWSTCLPLRVLISLNSEQPLGEGEADDDYDPKHAHVKKAGKNKANEPQEDVRANACTLKEHHDHLLSNSFDLSFSASQIPLGGGQDTSSSQAEGFLNDPFFSDGLDLGGDMGDELARELGEGWGAPPRFARLVAIVLLLTNVPLVSQLLPWNSMMFPWI